jgi:hypothetical protein
MDTPMSSGSHSKIEIITGVQRKRPVITVLQQY